MKHNIKRALGEDSMRVAVHAVAQDTGNLEEQEPPQWLPVSDTDSQSWSEHIKRPKRTNFPI